jgi:hypothetical protein
MGSDPVPIAQEVLCEALAFMQSALALLDRAGAPVHIGAHLDLAICELQSALERPAPPSSALGRRSLP